MSLVERIIEKIRQAACREHRYKKKYSKDKNTYVLKCSKCGKELDYEK